MWKIRYSGHFLSNTCSTLFPNAGFDFFKVNIDEILEKFH